MNQKLSIPTTELLADLREMCRQWRAQGNRLDMPGRLPSSPGAANVAPICQALEVTSSTADAYGYPARIQTYDGSTWADTYAEVRAVQIGSTIAGAVLATGFYPIGRLMYVSPTGLHVYGVFPGAGASVELRGLTFTSDTDSTADSDPGNGLFKWNNATQASATVLYFDDLTADSINVTTLFASLPQRGYIYLQQADDSTRWQIWKWTTITDASGYTKFTVTSQHGTGSAIADAKTVYALFVPSAFFSGVVLTHTGVDIVDSTITDISWVGTDGYDTDSYWSAGSPTLITLPFTGKYRFLFSGAWEGNATGTREMYLRTSGGTTLVRAERGGNGTYDSCMQLSWEKHYTAGDQVKASVYQDTGANLGFCIFTLADVEAFLTVHYLGVS